MAVVDTFSVNTTQNDDIWRQIVGWSYRLGVTPLTFSGECVSSIIIWIHRKSNIILVSYNYAFRLFLQNWITFRVVALQYFFEAVSPQAEKVHKYEHHSSSPIK